MLQSILDNVVTIKNDVKSLDQKLTKRIDTLGKDLAILDDDAPTREEFDILGKRITTLEQKITLN